MPPTDPNFWEIPLPSDAFDERAWDPIGDLLASGDEDEDKVAARNEAVAVLRLVIGSGLTERQRQVVQLHFFEGRSQAEIAEILGISQQSVSRQLFGVIRNGGRVGGALKRLRALLESEGVDPEKWV